MEREKAGLLDPTDEQRQRPLKEHLAEFERYLENRGVTPKQIKESTRQVGKMIADWKWTLIGDITADSALEFLGGLRRQGLSAQTYNHYLKAAKQFTRWLVRDRRTPTDPLAHLSRLNVRTDRRHDRRALSDEEFTRLLEAARTGPRIEGIRGLDRAMMYVLAAWTGFRKGEIGSLTLRSFQLDADPPTATVAACYSKRRRQDTQVLHPEVVRQLQEWLATEDLAHAHEPLFPISGRVPGGIDRKTHKMMEAGPWRPPGTSGWTKPRRTEERRRRSSRTSWLPEPRRAVRRLPQLPAPVHHQSGACRVPAQDGPDAGPAFGHSSDAGRVHARGVAGPDGGDRVAAGAAGDVRSTACAAVRRECHSTVVFRRVSRATTLWDRQPLVDGFAPGCAWRCVGSTRIGVEGRPPWLTNGLMFDR